MGDKAILTEILEASHLTESYSRLRPAAIFDDHDMDQLLEVTRLVRPSAEPSAKASAGGGATVRYESFTPEGGDGESVQRVQLDGGLRRTRSADNDCEDTFTVDEAVERLGFGAFQLKLSVLTGICWMADAMEMMILAILAPALHCEWWLGSWGQAMITTVVFCGMMLSSTLWGNLCDTYGRRGGLLLCAALTSYFGALSSLAPTFYWLLALRGLTGFGIGGAPQSVTLYAEFLPSAHRAKCVVFIEAFWSIGAALEVAVAYMLMSGWGWRWLLLVSSLPCFVFMASCLWLPESARYHVACGQMDKAYSTLERIAKDNGTSMPLGRLVSSTAGDESQRGRIADLLVPQWRRTTLLLWFVWLSNAFCYYGLVIFTTKMFESSDPCHGGSPKRVDPTCPLDCHRLDRADYLDLFWTTLAEFPGLILTAFIVEYMGRKFTLIFEYAVFALFTFLLFICTHRSVVTVFIFVARAFISGAFQAAYVYTPEVYPTTVRAIGMGSCSAMARLGAIVTPFVAQVAAEHSVDLPIAIYGAVALLGAAASFFLPIETKGRGMADTQ